MRPLLLGLVASLSLLSACGARRDAGTTTTASTRTEPAAAADANDDATPTAEAECTHWDPAGDRTAAPTDVGAPPEGARDGGDGLRFCIVRRGTSSERPTRESRVRVHYTGWTTDGQMFDSSYARGEPASFGVTEVIRGWTDSLLHMSVGQVRRVWIPAELAYRGQDGMPAGMLVFDIELVAIDR